MKKALRIVLVALMLMAMGAGYKLGHREANRARPAMAQALEHEESDPLLAFRTQREQLRSRQRAELNEIIHDADTDGQTLRAAREQLLRAWSRKRRKAASKDCCGRAASTTRWWTRPGAR